MSRLGCRWPLTDDLLICMCSLSRYADPYAGYTFGDMVLLSSFRISTSTGADQGTSPPVTSLSAGS